MQTELLREVRCHEGQLNCAVCTMPLLDPDDPQYLLVGTLNGDPLPKGDAARYTLIIGVWAQGAADFRAAQLRGALFGRPEPACSRTWVRPSAAAA